MVPHIHPDLRRVRRIHQFQVAKRAIVIKFNQVLFTGQGYLFLVPAIGAHVETGQAVLIQFFGVPHRNHMAFRPPGAYPRMPHNFLAKIIDIPSVPQVLRFHGGVAG